MKMELRDKKWKEKDLKEKEVKWMFKGWDPLRIGWVPLEGQMDNPLVDCMDAGWLVILCCIQFTFPYSWRVSEQLKLWLNKRGRSSHSGLNLSLGLLLLLTIPGQLTISTLPSGT